MKPDVDHDAHARLQRDFHAALAAKDACAYPEALPLLLACYQDPHQSIPVRDSFVASALAELADMYQPARTALLDLRARMTQQLLDNGGDTGALGAVLTIDRLIEDPAHSLQLALELDRRHGPQRRGTMELAEVFHQAGDIGRARAHLGDARAHVDRAVEGINRLSQHRPEPQPDDHVGPPSYFQHTLDLVTRILHASGEAQLADELLATAPQRIVNPTWRAMLEQELAHPGTGHAYWQRLQDSSPPT